VRLLRGARLITDLESRFEEETETDKLTKRHRDRVERRLEALSARYGLASRVMSLVAVVERAGDRPGDPPKTVVVPVGLPQDEEFEGVFGAPPSMDDLAFPSETLLLSRMERASTARDRVALKFGAALDRPILSEQPPSRRKADTFETLLDLVARLEADGGMPGDTEAERILATIQALLALAAGAGENGDDLFRLHIHKMEEFLARTLPDSLTAEQENAVRAAMVALHSGGFRKTETRDWLEWAARTVEGRETDADRDWERLISAFGGEAPRE